MIDCIFFSPFQSFFVWFVSPEVRGVMRASAAARSKERTGDTPNDRLGDLLQYLLQRGVVIRATSEAWKDNDTQTTWPDDLDQYLGPLDGINFERAVVHLLRLANSGTSDEDVHELCFPGQEFKVPETRDAIADEMRAQSTAVQLRKRRLMLLAWAPSAINGFPTEIDPDDLFCSALAGHCMAVVRAAVVGEKWGKKG